MCHQRIEHKVALQSLRMKLQASIHVLRDLLQKLWKHAKLQADLIVVSTVAVMYVLDLY